MLRPLKRPSHDLFRDAVSMVDQSPALSQRIVKSGTGLNVWNLAFLQTGSFFKPISSDDGQSGPRPHCALIDEVHEHKTNTVVEMMRAGTKGRRQALMFLITNSGHDKTSVCYDYHEYGKKVAAGDIEDDSFSVSSAHWMRGMTRSKMNRAGERLTLLLDTHLPINICVSRSLKLAACQPRKALSGA